jgi:hypothetical protein
MAKKTETELTTSTDAPIVVPDWMQQEEVKGADTLGDFMVTPRMTIVQAMSDHERKDAFGEGGVAIMPDGIKVAGKDEPFVVIPLIFWASWEQRSDLNDSATPMIENSTQDPNSEVARKARNKDTREETYGNGFTRKFVEALNFIVKIDSGEAKGELATISFSVGEHHTGSRLCGMLKRRPCSLFANRVELKTAVRQRNNRSWYGFEFNNPVDTPIIQDKEVYDKLSAMHDSLKGIVDSGAFKVADEGSAIPSVVNSESIPI